jgi:hypothetical protein
MRFNRWNGGVPAAAWLFLAIALVRFSVSWWNPAATGLIGMAPILLLALAIGVVLGSRTCWAAVFVLTGMWVTLLGMTWGVAVVGPSHAVYADTVTAFLVGAVQFGTVAALHPRWNARWAESVPR